MNFVPTYPYLPQTNNKTKINESSGLIICVVITFFFFYRYNRTSSYDVLSQQYIYIYYDMHSMMIKPQISTKILCKRSLNLKSFIH